MNFNIFDWRQSNENPYPILTIIVKDIFYVSFAYSGVLANFQNKEEALNKKQSQLSLLNIKTQICMDDSKRIHVWQQEAKMRSPEASNFSTDYMISITMAPRPRL